MGRWGTDHEEDRLVNEREQEARANSVVNRDTNARRTKRTEATRPEFEYRDNSENLAKRIRMYGYVAASQQRAREKADARYQSTKRALAKARKEWQTADD